MTCPLDGAHCECRDIISAMPFTLTDKQDGLPLQSQRRSRSQSTHYQGWRARHDCKSPICWSDRRHSHRSFICIIVSINPPFAALLCFALIIPFPLPSSHSLVFQKKEGFCSQMKCCPVVPCPYHATGSLQNEYNFS